MTVGDGSERPGASCVADRFGDNPFYVLGLPAGASRVEVERAGQRLLAMLELELSAAERYPTPLGERDRTVDKVRWAMAELRDPERRLGHELWARLAPELVVSGPVPRPGMGGGVAPDDGPGAPFAGAL